MSITGCDFLDVTPSGPGTLPTQNHASDTLLITGNIVGDNPNMFSGSKLPMDARVALIWNRADGTSYVWAVGDVDRLGGTWRLTVAGTPPDEALYADSDGELVLGQAQIHVVDGTIREGDVLSGDLLTWVEHSKGMAMDHTVYYDTDEATRDEWIQVALDGLAKGFSVAISKPVQSEDPMGSLYYDVSPVEPRNIPIVLHDR